MLKICCSKVSSTSSLIFAAIRVVSLLHLCTDKSQRFDQCLRFCVDIYIIGQEISFLFIFTSFFANRTNFCFYFVLRLDEQRTWNSKSFQFWQNVQSTISLFCFVENRNVVGAQKWMNKKNENSRFWSLSKHTICHRRVFVIKFNGKENSKAKILFLFL